MPGFELWQTVIEIVVSLGAVTAFGVVIRYVWNRYRWRAFKKGVEEWLTVAGQSTSRHPKELHEDD